VQGTVVSLVPSLTELVFWLGAGERLVGRTRFCSEPADHVKGIAVIGGTKDPVIERLLALDPALVLANHEENRREDVEALRAAGLEVVVTDPRTVDGAVAMVEELGELLGACERAAELAAETREALGAGAGGRRVRVFVPVWKSPLMGLGSDTYGHDLLHRCGAENVLGDRPRYPVTTRAEVAGLSPDLVLLPDEPYRFREADRQAWSTLARAELVDGKLLWWYGPRMPAAIGALRRLVAEVASG
jgi:ABC-type hemin transport system substrate-binding protein